MTLPNDDRILDCGHKPSPHSPEVSTGTAHTSDGREICWQCAADTDRKAMIESGRSRTLPLYLVDGPYTGKGTGKPFRVTNWPGTLSFIVTGFRVSNHNIGGKRTDVWFNGPDGFEWHGVQIGQWNQVCHARHTKKRVAV